MEDPTINGLCANRGAPSDYNEWDRMGAEGWNWDTVLPYFRKLERDLNFTNEMHGTNGPIAVSRFPTADWSGFVQAVASEIRRQGYPLVEDQNGVWQDGVMPVTASVDENGQRVSCAYAYLRPARSRAKEPHRSDADFGRADCLRGTAGDRRDPVREGGSRVTIKARNGSELAARSTVPRC